MDGDTDWLNVSPESYNRMIDVCVLNLQRSTIKLWAIKNAGWHPSNEQCDALLLELGITP
jgi:hypothetical protein